MTLYFTFFKMCNIRLQVLKSVFTQTQRYRSRFINYFKNSSADINNNLVLSSLNNHLIDLDLDH